MGVDRGGALGEKIIEKEGLQHRDTHLSKGLILPL
jgi:hypothetical protein